MYNMTHLPALQISMKSAGGFWYKKNTVKVLEYKTFQFRNKNMQPRIF